MASARPAGAGASASEGDLGAIAVAPQPARSARKARRILEIVDFEYAATTPMIPTKWLLLLIFAAGALGCGARSTLREPTGDVDGGAADAATDSGAKRICALGCTVGHECCAGSCDGPAVPMPSDCCSCLPGEISSAECGGECGGSP